MRRLKGDRAKLGYASIVIQVANFVLLLVANVQVPVDEFAFLLTQLAVAGIVGAIATMQLEILIYQKHGRMTRSVAFVPAVASLCVIGLIYMGYGLVMALVGGGAPISMLAIPTMLGLSLSLAQNFVFIQIKRVNLLLASRACQGAGLIALTAVLALGTWDMGGRLVLLLSGLCYLLPALIWMGCYLVQFKPRADDPPSFFVPEWDLFKRGVSLTMSTGINAVYVNLPLLVAAATQSISFVADFGLILRCFTGPVTLIRQVFGQMFLAEAIRWSTEPDRVAQALRQMVTRTMLQSVGAYLLLAPFFAAILYFNLDSLRITHGHIVPYLALAVLGQCAINPVSHVRIPLSDERAFLLFDACRLIGLALGLYGLALLVPYEIAFGVTAFGLYAGYILFIHRRIERYPG